MKFSKLTFSSFVAVSLGVGGCTSGTSGSDDTSGATDSMPSGDSSGSPAPLPEFDCEGVDGVFEGNITVESAADLPQLMGVREITRNLIINKTELADLDALACLQTVGENLQIFGNASLTNVDGLVNITEVTGALVFSENDALVDFDGLQRLKRVGSSLSMNKNDGLTKISGFNEFVGVQENITIRDNPVLTNIDGFKGMKVVGGVLAITANPNLCLSSVNCVGEGIETPPVPPDDWSTNANNPDC